MFKNINLIYIFIILLTSFSFSETVYENAEDENIDAWVIRDGEGYVRNEYAPEINSRVIHLGGGDAYDLWIDNNRGSWNNTTERILSFRMKFTGTFLLYVSVDTTDGHRWLFSNRWNGHYGYHQAGILNGYGSTQTHNTTWQTMVLDLDRLLHDTEPNLDIVRVNSIRLDLTTDAFVDDIQLDTPQRTSYENGDNGTVNWHISDNTPTGATITTILDDEETTLRHADGTAFGYVYNDHVIRLQGDHQENAFTIGSDNSAEGWNNQNQTLLQWKMRSSELFEVTVHLDTDNGTRELHYTPVMEDNGRSENGLEIHHGLGISRNGDGEASRESTDGRWITYTRDLADDLRDYDPHNRVVAVNGMTIRGVSLVDDIQLIDTPEEIHVYPVNALYEDAEDGTSLGWSIFDDNSGTATIHNIIDPDKGDHVISLEGQGTRDGYMLGERAGDGRWRNRQHDTIQWSMNYDEVFVVYIATETSNGERNLVYTAQDDDRGLSGTSIMIGLGADADDGGWRTFTRNIAEDIASVEPDNELLSINAFLIRGSGRIDNIKTRSSENLIPDTTPPLIRLLGNAVESISVGEEYHDAGAVAEDDMDGIISANIVVDNDLNINQAGVYHITYNVVDAANNQAREVTRTVNVIAEQRPPVVLEDAEDGNSDGWSVRDGSSEEASINNVFDADIQSHVIEVDGTAGTTDSYILVGNEQWNASNGRTITWKMNFDENVVVYVLVHTEQGDRYLFYTPSPNTALLHGFTGGVHHGLSDSMQDGRWRQITRNLDDDLHDAEPENTILSVEAFLVRGHGRFDDIRLYNPISVVYEDGESGINGWNLFDNTAEGATISNIVDTDLQGNHRQGNVISLQGDGFNNAYILGAMSGNGAWNNETEKIVQWKFRDFGPEPEILSADPDERGTIRDPQAFEFRVSVETTAGHREMIYTLGADNLGLIENGIGIHHGLGDDRIRGSIWAGDDPQNILGAWHSVTRDLEEDIMDFEPNNRLISVNAFIVRNSGLVDDIKMYSKIEDPDNGLEILSSNAENTTETETDIRAVLNQVGQLQIEYGESTAYGLWSTREDSFNWATHIQHLSNLLANQIYHYRVHAWDENGVEVISEDATFNTLGGGILYEDAEDNNIEGWSIYDNDPVGATITNIEDATRGNHVISLDGDIYNNGYMLGGRTTDTGWNNTQNRNIRWSMNYNELFVIYIPINTSNGRRYMVYENREDDRGESNGYIRLGIGADASDGTWQTFTQNIEADLQRFEPENQLLSIDGFMIRGSGRLDDISLF